MGLFGPSREEKQREYQQKILEEIHKLDKDFGLNIKEDGDMNIMLNLAQNMSNINMLQGAYQLGSIATNNPIENMKIMYLSTLINQNWLIIKRLTDILSLLKTNSNDDVSESNYDMINKYNERERSRRK